MVKKIDFYLGRRKSSAEVGGAEFELGNVLKVNTFAQDWMLEVVYKDGNEYHKTPSSLEAFVNHVGEDAGRVKDIDLHNSGVKIRLNEKYDINIKYLD